jgi:transcriptional regulator with XRE-family HTH domain
LAESSAFGEILKRAREERGIALDAVAGTTRICRRHLEALENGDLASLPGGPFGRSYLRSYAEFLGIDPEPILGAYRSQEVRQGLAPSDSRDRTVRELAQLLDRRPGKKRIHPWPAIAAVVALFALAAFFLARWPSREPLRAPPPEPPRGRSVAPAKAEAVAVEAARPPEPALEKEPHPPDRLVVAEAALGTEIVNHTVTGRKDRFSEGERVAFWTRVHAASPGGVIHHYWLHEGRAVMKTVLRIGSANWRTFSRYTLPEGSSGSWVVEARDDKGRVLAREEFLCVEGSD